MSYAPLVKARLAADATLTALLTGGVHESETLGWQGASKLPSSAYTDGGKLKPLVVVKGRAIVATGEITNQANQYTTTRQVVELWFYDDRDAAPTTLISAANRAYALMQFRPVTGSFWCSVVSNLRDLRALEYNDAHLIRMELEIRGKMEV